ncbi:MAG: peptide deformylase, partial [Deltaproteobacteria bacterium]|nr:peptide deformylase [Deltaproteobacteria bacterium]
AGGIGFLKFYKYRLGVRKIIEYPAPILRKDSTPVEVIDDEIVSLSHQMISTLRYNSLIGFFTKALLNRGLAAPQVGVSKRLIACALYGEIRVLINPEIVEQHGSYSGYETCMSLPSHDRKMIKRPGFIKVKFKGLDNMGNLLEASKGYAALLAHEIDHLNGTLYIDYKDDKLHKEAKDPIDLV